MRDSAEPDAVRLYPIFAKLEGRLVLVVGAGTVAEHKVEGLIDAGALVRVVAPDATDGIRRLASAGTIEWRARTFEEADVDGAWLVLAATSTPDVQRQVATAAEGRHCFAIAVDDPSNASAYSGAIVRRPPLLVAISTSGLAPALARLVREVIEHVLPSADTIAHATRLRAKWLAEGKPMGERFLDLVRELKKT